jgi:16S rRNA (cytosine967-C5)-methyltransferase
VGAGKGHSDELLHSARTDELTLEDRNLATALVMGVLRWEIALDARLAKLLSRPEQRLAEPVALALRMGAFQLLHMDRIPAHAVLNESVEMCRAAGQPHAAGMVNAVLRKLAATQKPGARIFESAAAFAERLGHPLWLVERWAAAYGRDAALAICEYGQKEPAAGGLFVEAGADVPTARDAAPKMDDGSRLVAELAAAAMPIAAGRAARVWDCCAAPGGKTLMLALRLNPHLKDETLTPASKLAGDPETQGTGGAEILATDVSAKRMALMVARLRRYAYAERVQCAVADASAVAVKDERDAKFDLILCDVPCSGTGTLARNPEIRHRLRVEDLARQAARQRAILRGAIARLAAGGRLVYSTCSLEPEENEQVIAAVLAATPFARQLPLADYLEALRKEGFLTPAGADRLQAGLSPEGYLHLLPGAFHTDGFFIAMIEKVG